MLKFSIAVDLRMADSSVTLPLFLYLKEVCARMIKNFSLLLGLVLLVGCGGVSTTKVTGTVTLDGKPLPDATVTFFPVEGGTGVTAAGITDASGNYSIKTIGENQDGAVAGSYLVGVSAASKGKSEVPMDNDSAEYENYQSDHQGTGGQKLLVGMKYINPTTSGLTAEVTAGSDNVFDFDVSAK